MNQFIKYRLAARTEAAGKFNPEAPQEGNEDNYGLICDVAHPGQQPGFDEVVDLGEMGLLMYVADGMGGHNAGEVASKIAVDTVSEAFAEGRVSPGIAASHEARYLYLEGIIREADKRIRSHAKKNKECDGMGSTLILAWLVGGELTVSWCGDSRCYIYRPLPTPRIGMVSEDHSYVQELVQRGVIPYEATFAHPRGNIITRCLGGGGENADPESRLAKVGKGDIVLLCSDGLSGVLFDDGRLFDGQPISEENICDIVSARKTSLRECLQELFAAAERQNWYDNVTVVACEIVDGPQAPTELPVSTTHIEDVPAAKTHKKRKWLWLTVAILAILTATGGAVWWYVNNAPKCEPEIIGATCENGIMRITGTAEQCHVKISDTLSDSKVWVDTIIDTNVYQLPKELPAGSYRLSLTAICKHGESVSKVGPFIHKTRQEDSSSATQSKKPVPHKKGAGVENDKSKDSTKFIPPKLLVPTKAGKESDSTSNGERLTPVKVNSTEATSSE